ncbi:MAG: hypothetical protein RLZZ568_887 [Cyanobacteriota bacterium]|jgi:site-specific recombinase XerD
MNRHVNVWGTFVAFSITLAIAHNIPTQIADLPNRSVAIAQQSKNRAKLTILRSWHDFIVRKHRSTGNPLGQFSRVKLHSSPR